MSNIKGDGDAPEIPASVAGINSTVAKFRWSKVVELGYQDDSQTSSSGSESEEGICFHCGKTAAEAQCPKFSRCAKCEVATYCSRDCQVKNWKGGDGKVGHKFSCAAYKRVGSDMMIIFSDDKDQARQDILSRVRFYAFPYAVHKSLTQGGRGLLFIQSDSTLAAMSLPTTVSSNGRPITKLRSVLLHWLTMKEYDSELCKDDFEMATVRSDLKVAVETYDEQIEVTVLMRFRCGHVAVGVAPIVPDYKLCVALGKEYYGSGQGAGGLQLNIDDM